MAIDRRLYEKYSGRTGDPYARLGEALAKGVAEKSRREDAKYNIRMRGRAGWRWFGIFRLLGLFR
jgi:hypothetical protein